MPRDMNARVGGRDFSTINSEEAVDSDKEQVFFPGRSSGDPVYRKVFGLRKNVLI